MEKKIVFITGASSGIGEGCARKFAMNGYRLILNGRNVEKLAAVKRELETEYHADVCLLPFDVRDRRAAAAALDSLPEAWKAIDILINNAVTAEPGTPFMEQSEEYLTSIFESGFLSTWRLMKLCFP